MSTEGAAASADQQHVNSPYTSGDESLIICPRNGQPRRSRTSSPKRCHQSRLSENASRQLSKPRELRVRRRRRSQNSRCVDYSSSSSDGRSSSRKQLDQRTRQTDDNMVYDRHAGSKRRRTYVSNSDHSTNNIQRKRRHYSPNAQSHKRVNTNLDDKDNTNSILDKFLEILKDVKGRSSSRLSLNNVIPEFDPMTKDQTILMWLTKVEECAEIYGWDERETIHFALPKLAGVAKTWYQGLSTVLYSWTEWKRKLVENFPCRDDYAELLIAMLAKKARYGESLEHYFYEKTNLLNRCGIKGRKAVDCILNGIEDRAVRVGAQAAQFREPEEVLKYIKTVKIGSIRDAGEKSRKHDRKVTGTTVPTRRNGSESTTRFVCHNCNEEGHKSIQCQKTPATCTNCGKLGHLSTYCRFRKQKPQDSGQKETVGEKMVSELTSGESNSKYIFKILINNVELVCHVDLGSQCSLIRESEANSLKLSVDTKDLPLMRAIGGNYVSPLGRSKVDVNVQGIEANIEILIVENHALKYPVLLGHTFTELPDLIITKTPSEIIFEKIGVDRKLFLKVTEVISLAPCEIVTVPVNSCNHYNGKIYVNGSMRGTLGSEYYLFPGEYDLKSGIGKVIVFNMSESRINFDKNTLLTRAFPGHTIREVSVVSADKSDLEEHLFVGPTITNEQKVQLQCLLNKFKDCFSSNLKELGLTSAGEMIIELENSEPVVYRPYRMSFAERSLVRDMVNEMLDAGIVRESSSPYASPIVLVKKKTGEKRLCVDYRALNKRTKKDHYPLPRVEDQLDQLAGSKLFISLDLASGYYQIPISTSSQDKTAFVTPDGQYEYTRMPFGLVNAPSVFQRTINKILSEAKIKYALVYMDDILIPARTFEEGLVRLQEVLVLLRKGKLTLKLSKCHFFFDKIDFLGFEVSSVGIKPGTRKIEAVAKFPVPKNQHETRQFIGLASFFRRFVKGFAVICKPLTDLLKKDCQWKWTKEQNDSFDSLKQALISRPILALYDPKRETQLHTDACKHGIAGILMQKCDEGLLKPVSYFSRKTTPDEQRMHSFELETLAVVASLSRFRVYLLGIPFKILTDCNALRTTLIKRDLVSRIARWWVQLQEFDCEIEYRPGSGMMHADALSRNPVDKAVIEDHILDVLSTETEDWIATVQSTDEEISRIKRILADPESGNVLEIVKNYKIKNGKVYRLLNYNGADCVRWVVPKGVRWQVVKMNHDDIGHFGFEKTLSRIQQTFWFPKMRRFVKKYVQSCLECAHHKGTTGKQQGELHPIPKVEIPFHTIHADHLGPFVRSKRGNVYILVIIDGFTKFINISPVKNTKTSTTIRVLREHISYFGTPVRLITDQGTSFTSNNFRSFTKSLGIKHILNAVATPRANGQVERFNRTIIDALSTKTHGKDERTWDEFIPDVQIGLNTTVHKTTGKSPSELLFGVRLKSQTENRLSEVIDEVIESISSEDLDKERSKAGERINNQQIKDKVRFDSKRIKNKSYVVGDLVSVKREIPNTGKSKKLLMKFRGPYRIIKVLPNDRYLVTDSLTRKKGCRSYENIIAVDRMKPWLSFNQDFVSSDSECANAASESEQSNDTA